MKTIWAPAALAAALAAPEAGRSVEPAGATPSPPPALARLMETLGVEPGQFTSPDMEFVYAYEPPRDRTLNPDFRDIGKAYDLWGRAITPEEAEAMDPAELSPAAGAVPIDEETLNLGQRAFYTETFGNERALTDLIGLGRGPISVEDIIEASLALEGEGTTNLAVTLDHDTTIAGETFKAGTSVATGLDVPKDAAFPMGVRLSWRLGEPPRVGITCSLCHSTVEPESKEVIHGAVNVDARIAPILAFAPNTAAYFIHSSVDPSDLPEGDAKVETTEGVTVTLPDIAAFEDAVDRQFLSGPPGYNNTTFDLQGDPGQIPDSFTFDEHPFLWTGSRAAGPFNGLSAVGNAVHAVGADPTTQAVAAGRLIGVDPEVYLGLLLRNASLDALRWSPESGLSPSEHFNHADPTPGPGLTRSVKLPGFPQRSLITDLGVAAVAEETAFWESINAMSAWQNHLLPPINPIGATEERAREGRRVFEAAGCVECHSGPTLTNHRIVPLEEIGTNAARAEWPDAERLGPLAPPILYAFDEPIPLPEDAATIKVPQDRLDQEQIELSLPGIGDRLGYAVPGLLGLYWSAPYLHEGGVAVGPGGELGMANTQMEGILPEPRASLRALVDRELRADVVEANRNDPRTAAQSITGAGHEYWVDAAAGFSAGEQAALLDYLLALPLAAEPRAGALLADIE